MKQDRKAKAANVTPLRAMGVAGVCGIDIAISVLAGVLLGSYLDGRFGTSPLLLIVGLFVGLIAGFYTTYRIIAPIVRSIL